MPIYIKEGLVWLSQNIVNKQIAAIPNPIDTASIPLTDKKYE